MPVRTPEPRIPLEPEEYPLYRPPSRIGCSGLSLVALITVLVFGVLFLVIAPPIVKGLTGRAASLVRGSDQAAATPGVGTAGIITDTAAVAQTPPTNTPVLPSPTPARSCFKVTGTGREGTPLREQPKTDAKRIIPAGRNGVQDGAVFEMIGPDVSGGKDTAGKDIIYKHVLLPNDGRSGYILAKFLEPAPCP